MLKVLKNKKSILILIIFLISCYLLISSTINNENLRFIKKHFSYEFKQSVKKIFFPYKYIEELERKKSFFEPELILKKELNSVIFENQKTISLFGKEYFLKKYSNFGQLSYGIANLTPGSAYLDFYDGNLFLLSSTGILGFSTPNNNQIHFKQIKNNINKYINEKQFMKSNWFSTKDLEIFNNKIYVSYTNEIKEDCWNTSIIAADLNYEELIFEKLFEPSQCVDSVNNEDGEFNAHQSGGRIIKLDDENIIFSTGDYRSRKWGQDKNSVLGKILKININNGNYDFISKGHRNPQGLSYDKENNYIISTEHGPLGGDEINLIKLDADKIPNYGWAIASYGEHYGGKSEKNKSKYQKYPLHKSHKNYGFVEPLKFFTPSIGISEIIGVGNKRYIVSSMKDKSIYTFKLNEKQVIKDLKRIEIGERIRDIIFNGQQIFLFLEDNPSIGIIKYN